MDPVGLVAATERLYRSLFTAAVGFALGAALWGLVIAPFNGFDHNRTLSLGLGVVLVGASLAAFVRRGDLFVLLRRHPAWLLAAVALSVAVLWGDGGWRSSYYLASYAAIALAAVVGGLRWSFLCAAVLAAGYVAGLAINGYSWTELVALKDGDSVVANTGGYLIAAYFFAAPASWLGGYVARINQVVGSGTRDHEPGESTDLPDSQADHRLTDKLSVREVEVVQLVAGGATNDEIASRLFLSPRTIQSHVKSAMEKTGTRNRTELAVLAVREGLVPAHDEQAAPALSETPPAPV
jgi:DNA-binding CsgD family transcriptional regulator